MALLLVKRVPIRPRLAGRGFPGFLVDSDTQRYISKASCNGESFLISRRFWMHIQSNACRIEHRNAFIRLFSTNVGLERLCWEGSPQSVLLNKLELALKCRQVDEAWESFSDFTKLYGFPEDLLVRGLITELSYSSDPVWLRKACDLVRRISKEKSGLLQLEILSKLSLSLARAQLSSLAGEILRLMLEKDMLPTMSILQLVVLHMVKTEIGTHLATNFLAQICESFLRIFAKDRNRAELMKPDTLIFNLVLGACVRFKLAFKGEKIMELMPRIGVVADAYSIVIISRILEMNGQRDELKKYKARIEQISPQFLCHYRHLYDSLLSLHFKFNDIDSAAKLMWQICRIQESVPVERNRKFPPKSFLIPIGSDNLRDGLKMQIQPELLQKDTVLKVEGKQELVVFRNGKLVLSNKALAKLVKGFKSNKNVTELSKLLLRIQKELCSVRGSNLCSDVIKACIQLGWLEFAHDILDDTEASEAPVGCTTYMLLLTEYLKGKMLRDAKALLNQMRKHGMVMNLADKMVITEYLSGVNSTSTSDRKSGLIDSFVKEMRDEKTAVSSEVYELNSSIHFFCKAKMIGDAKRAYRRMQEMKIQPTTETFANLLSGFSSLEMYRDITILWGDMKRNTTCANLLVNRDLYEHLLMSFLRGGYFERVMEVIEHMNNYGMFADKLMYRSEFLKFHKNLYWKLKASEAKTEAQRERLRYVLAFRKWAGID